MWPWTSKKEKQQEESRKFPTIVSSDERRDAAQVGLPVARAINFLLLRKEQNRLIAASAFLNCRDHIADVVKAQLFADGPRYLSTLWDHSWICMDTNEPYIGIVCRGTDEFNFLWMCSQIVQSLRILEVGMGWSERTTGKMFFTPVPMGLDRRILTCVLCSPSRWVHAPQLLSIYTLAIRIAAYHGIPRSLIPGNKEDVYATGRLLRYYRYLRESQPFAFYETEIAGDIRKMVNHMPDTSEYLPECLEILPTVLAYEKLLFDGSIEDYYSAMSHGVGGIINFRHASYNEAISTARENLIDLLKTKMHNSTYKKITEVLNGREKQKDCALYAGH